MNTHEHDALAWMFENQGLEGFDQVHALAALLERTHEAGRAEGSLVVDALEKRIANLEEELRTRAEARRAERYDLEASARAWKDFALKHRAALHEFLVTVESKESLRAHLERMRGMFLEMIAWTPDLRAHERTDLGA